MVSNHIYDHFLFVCMRIMIFFSKLRQSSMYVFVMGGRSQLRIPPQEYAYEHAFFRCVLGIFFYVMDIKG